MPRPAPASRPPWGANTALLHGFGREPAATGVDRHTIVAKHSIYIKHCCSMALERVVRVASERREAVSPPRTQPADRRGTPAWLFALAISAPCAFLVFVAVQPLVPPEQMFRDVYRATTTTHPGEFPPLLGLASNLGIVLWCASAAVAAFGGLQVLRAEGFNERVICLFSVGFLSALLMADDLLMIHEFVVPAFGLHEIAAFALYAAILVGIVVRFRGLMSRFQAGTLLWASLLCFAAGLAADLAIEFAPAFDGDLQRWAEDAPKLIGIALWTAFVFRLTWLSTARG